MNVLITNSQEVQAYTILRSLRPTAQRIVVTEGGDSVGSTGFRGMAVFSRFADATYRVPHFAADWLAGRLEAENTATEEDYVRRIEEICRLESIDVIFPSLDPEVYLFAKNKRRLAEQGILAVVPEPDVIRIPMDKALTIRAAQRVGFPCPKTFFPESIDDLESIRAQSEPPWIVKPRFTAHGAHMEFVDEAANLGAAFAKVSDFQSGPIIQEYIEGGLRSNYYVTVDRDGQILSMLAPRVVRAYRAGYRVSSKTCVSASSGPHDEKLRALLIDLGLWGGYTIQMQVDPRDSIPKLIEINPRLGQHLWWRTGLDVNEPLILLQLARGETPSGNFNFPAGVTMLDPFHDAFFLYNQIVNATLGTIGRLIRRQPYDTDESQPSIRTTLGHYRRDYFHRRPKLHSPEVANLLVDPYPCLRAFWHKFRSMTGGYLRRIVGFVRRKSDATSASVSV